LIVVYAGIVTEDAKENTLLAKKEKEETRTGKSSEKHNLKSL